MSDSIPVSLLSSLTRYSLGVGAAAAAVACLPGAAQATVFEYDVPNGGISGGTIFFDLESAASTDSSVTHVSNTNFAGADFKLYSNVSTAPPKASANIKGYNNATIAVDTSNSQNNALRFGGGQEIGEGLQSFGSSGQLYYGKVTTSGQTQEGNFPPGSTGFLGLRLDLTPITEGTQPEAQPFIYYGWAEISYSSTPNGTSDLNLIRFAYDDSGANIFTPIPEPNAALLLIAGAAGLGTLRTIRQRRRQRAESTAAATTA